ncbi:MAG: 4Fe-4S double cluster binding domain-containing protein [Candidatus Kariarchaeaceae archaeon]|jgi:epoxyqueuosine reductase
MVLKTFSPTESFEFRYKYKTIAVDHLQELQEDIDQLKRTGKLSSNETYRSYIDDMKFALPEDFPEAKSIVVMAIYNKPLLVNLHLSGDKHRITIPPQYYVTGLKTEYLQALISNDIIKKPGFRIERTTSVHLKLLAVRSSLGKYGRNNLCYVEGMGTMLALFAFFTDYQFDEDHWSEKNMMDRCVDCRICLNRCPNKAISENNFVVDVGKCITLYNEVEGEFPEWVEPDIHNALFGCMKCQEECPENRAVIDDADWLEDIPADIAKKLLQGRLDENDHSLYDRLLLSDPTRLKVTTRNLIALVNP